MASVDFYKCKGGSHAKSILRHNDKDKRTVTKEHDNTQLDTSKTHLNTSVYGRSYDEVCRLYDERISELDATTNSNKRKDRVTMFDLNIPMPENLPPEKEDEWALKTVKIIAKKYGLKNILEGYIHRDEKHEYVDARTHEKKESRTHLTVSVIPEVDGQLKGKEFSSRKNMMSLNREIEKMSMEQYGIHFMTGKGRKGTDKVEDLKGLSRQAEADLLAEQERLARERERLVRQDTELTQRKSDIELLEKEQQEKADEYQRWEDALDAQKKVLEVREEDVTARETAVEARETAQIASEKVFKAEVKAFTDTQKETARQVLKKSKEVQDRETAVTEREKDVTARETAVKARETAVTEREEKMTERESRFGEEVRKAAAKVAAKSEEQRSRQPSRRTGYTPWE